MTVCAHHAQNIDWRCDQGWSWIVPPLHFPSHARTHTHTQHTHNTHTTHTNSLQEVWSICNWLTDHQGGDEWIRYAILQKPQLLLPLPPPPIWSVSLQDML